MEIDNHMDSLLGAMSQLTTEDTIYNPVDGQLFLDQCGYPASLYDEHLAMYYPDPFSDIESYDDDFIFFMNSISCVFKYYDIKLVPEPNYVLISLKTSSPFYAKQVRDRIIDNVLQDLNINVQKFMDIPVFLKVYVQDDEVLIVGNNKVEDGTIWHSDKQGTIFLENKITIEPPKPQQIKPQPTTNKSTTKTFNYTCRRCNRNHGVSFDELQKPVGQTYGCCGKTILTTARCYNHRKTYFMYINSKGKCPFC